MSGYAVRSIHDRIALLIFRNSGRWNSQYLHGVICWLQTAETSSEEAAQVRKVNTSNRHRAKS